MKIVAKIGAALFIIAAVASGDVSAGIRNAVPCATGGPSTISFRDQGGQEFSAVLCCCNTLNGQCCAYDIYCAGRPSGCFCS